MQSPSRITVPALAACLAGLAMLSACSDIKAALDETKAEAQRTNTEFKARKAAESGAETPVLEGSPVRVTMDSKADAPHPGGIYHDIEGAVSANPKVQLTLDASMGAFTSCMINLYVAGADGTESGKAWAITDYGADTKVLTPDAPFGLASPGKGVTIITPDGAKVDSIGLQSGQTYIALLVVTGEKKAHTHKVRFTVK